MARPTVTRRQILDLSAALFATNGYRSTSLELVAERLGVTRQALYYHFRSKGEILGALFDELMTKMEVAVAAVDAEAGVQRFATMVRAHIDVTVADPRLMALLLHERPEIAKLKPLKANKRRRDYARLFVEAYEEGVQQGSLRAIDPWVAVNTLLAAINGVSWWFHGEDGSSSVSGVDVRRHLDDLLAHGFLLASADGEPGSPAASRASVRGQDLQRRARR